MLDVAVVGGGAAGFFTAITIAEQRPDLSVVLFEGSRTCLSKVKISGGGRCNVTHACFDPKQLVAHYPRGEKELLGPFHHFGPEQLIKWFARHGVDIKQEADGRMFPVTDSSQTIIDCFKRAASEAGIELRKCCPIQTIKKEADTFIIKSADHIEQTTSVILATGSSPTGHQLAQRLGHSIVKACPSLFTFKCDKWVQELAGLSVSEARVSLPDIQSAASQQGPVLCTHWGISGPAVLRASAFVARALARLNYRCAIQVNWLPQQPFNAYIDTQRREAGQRKLAVTAPSALPRRLWLALCAQAGIEADKRWSQLDKHEMKRLCQMVNACPLQMQGKTTFKEEFVTAGGVQRSEINWSSMESKVCPGLFLAGECIDVDAVTGGFNFQHAWTSAWLAARAVVEADKNS